MLHRNAGMSAPWNTRAKAEKINSSFKIKYGRVFADLWAPGVHPLCFVLIPRSGNIPVLNCLTASEMPPLLTMQLFCTIKEGIIYSIKVVSNFSLPSS